jgi:hypothetical protein
MPRTRVLTDRESALECCSAPRRQRDRHVEPLSCRSHNPQPRPLAANRLSLRQELHKPGAAPDSLPEWTIFRTDGASLRRPPPPFPKASNSTAGVSWN